MKTQLPPMRCREAAPYLAPLVDGELGEPLRWQVAAHAAACPRCAATVTRYQAVDRVLAGLPRTAPSPAVFERVQRAIAEDPAARREPLRPRALRARRQVRRRLAGLLWPEPMAARPQPAAAARRRSGIAAALVVLLLVSLAGLTFSRLRLERSTGPSAGPAPAQTAGSVLQRTQSAVAGLRARLTFTPVLPSYLPPGATLAGARVTPQAGVAMLVVTWNVPGSDIHQLRLSEAPRALGMPGYALASASAAYSWQISAAPWRPVCPLGTRAQPCSAVGQTRAALTLVLAASAPAVDPLGETAATLRLVSLSLDLPYLPLAVKPAVTTGLVLHTVERSATPGAWRREVYDDPARALARIVTTGANGVPLTTDILGGQRGLRLDARAQTAARLPANAFAAELTPPGSRALGLFYQTYTLLGYGELWNEGAATYDGAAVYRLALVNAPTPTTVYVSATTLQAVAVVVGSSTSERPGGPLASSRMASGDGCGSYTVIEYLPAARVPASLFTPAIPSGYGSGSVAPVSACPA